MTKIVDVRERTVRLNAAIRNSLVDFSQMTVSIVAVQSDHEVAGRPVVGLGFNSIGRYAQSGPLRDRFIDRLLAATPDEIGAEDGSGIDPARVLGVLMRNEKPGGHGERSGAVAALEIAVWDLVAKLEGVPLYRLLADRYNGGQFDTHVDVYAAGGYYSDAGLKGVLTEMQGYLDSGYTHLKMKIGGAPLDEDMERIEAVLELVPDGGHLAVDANGRFDLETAIAYAERMDPYGLRWYEEAGDPLDFGLQAALGEHYSHPFATAENLFSHQDVRNLLCYAGMDPERDLLQMDPGLSYGIVELTRMLDVMADEGWSPRRLIPHGGHSMALHMAAGLQLGGNESYPGIFQPFGGFGRLHEVVEGRIEIANSPGIGLEDKEELRSVLEDLVA